MSPMASGAIPGRIGPSIPPRCVVEKGLAVPEGSSRGGAETQAGEGVRPPCATDPTEGACFVTCVASAMVAPPRIGKALATLLVVAGVVQAATPIRNHDKEFLLERWTDKELPETFDAREAWFGCGATVLDQGHCGSCWAVSAAGVLADRWCVHKTVQNNTVAAVKGTDFGRAFERGGTCKEPTSGRHGCTRVAQTPSPMTLMSCCSMSTDVPLGKEKWNGLGCGGGDPDEAWKFLTLVGATEMTIQPDGQYGGCTPYTSGGCLTDPLGNGCKTCQSVLTECQDTGAKPELFRTGRYGQVLVPGQKRTTFGGDDCTGNSGNPAQVRAIQAEIMVNGPVHACYSVLSDFVDFFNHFPGGVYNSKLGDRVQKIGGHCIKLIGWGKDKYTGLDYWLIQNTWSENWGTAGVFRYVRGKDLCGIESDVWAACPPGTEKTCRFTKHVIPDPGRNATVLSDVPAASYGGGKWMEVDLDHPFVSRAKSHLHAELGVAQLPSFSRVSTQVANGIRVRMEVDVEREGILLGSQFPPHAYVYHESVASPPTLTVHS